MTNKCGHINFEHAQSQLGIKVGLWSLSTSDTQWKPSHNNHWIHCITVNQSWSYYILSTIDTLSTDNKIFLHNYLSQLYSISLDNNEFTQIITLIYPYFNNLSKFLGKKVLYFLFCWIKAFILTTKKPFLHIF